MENVLYEKKTCMGPRSGDGSRIEILDLGKTRYEDALSVQDELVQKRIDGLVPDTLVITEHFPVVTLGRQTEEDTIIDGEFFRKKDIRIVRTGRGGEITYHAPGQLVVYPVVDLKEKGRDVSRYIDLLEKSVVNSLRSLGIQAERCGEKRGVWLGDRKIAFIGIAVKKWITFHGVAVNINNDTEAFLKIKPCGESGIKVTSAKEYLGHDLGMDEVKMAFAEGFVDTFDADYNSGVGGSS